MEVLGDLNYRGGTFPKPDWNVSNSVGCFKQCRLFELKEFQSSLDECLISVVSFYILYLFVLKAIKLLMSTILQYVG